MKAEEFIAFARKLLTLPAARCPAGFRSVTSRLYYGADHEALDFIEVELGFAHRKIDDNINKHQFVLEYLTGSNEEHAQDLATQLSQLHEHRKNADYDISKERFDKENCAIASVVRVDRIVRALDACRDASVQAKIKAGMSVFRARRSPPAIGAP
jgi:hypothetical protein